MGESLQIVFLAGLVIGLLLGWLVGFGHSMKVTIRTLRASKESLRESVEGLGR